MSSDLETKPVLNFDNHCTCSLLDCTCDGKAVHEWTWDESLTSPKMELFNRNLAVKFHPGYSTGTVAVRGNRFFEKGRHHYWEVKMLTAPYGTDVSIGIGTAKAELVSMSYWTLLGQDRESWGLSYRGYLRHNGERRDYSSGFSKDSVVRIHLDTWKGTLQFFVDNKPIGVAFSGLRDLQLYPMACSTAAESKMRITYSSSVPVSLQMDCLGLLRPMQRAYLRAAFPALRHISESVFADVLRRHGDQEDEEDDDFYQRFTILDDFDFALVGCPRKKKKENSYGRYATSNALADSMFGDIEP